MEKNLITEIHRISELIGIKNNTLLNESIIGDLFKNVVESELIAILRAEVKAAITNGVEVVGKGRAISSTEELARKAIMTKTGLKSLTAAQKSGIKVELIRLAQEEAEAAAKQGSKELADRGIVINFNQTIQNNAKQMMRNGVTKTTKSGARKTLKATAKDVAEVETKGLTKVIEKGGAEEVEVMVKKGLTFKEIVKKSAVRWGLGLLAAGLIAWWILTTMNTVPDDTPVTPPVTPPVDDTDDGDGQGNGDFPLEDGAYTWPGDPYQYKVVECIWYTKSWKNRGKIIEEWKPLETNKTANDILDKRHPEARKSCSNNSEETPNVIVGDNTDPNANQTSGDQANKKDSTIGYVSGDDTSLDTLK